MKGSITIDRERCKGCSLCMEYCPKNAISLSSVLNMKGYFTAEAVEGKECSGCGTCALVCPDVAIEVYRS